MKENVSGRFFSEHSVVANQLETSSQPRFPTFQLVRLVGCGLKQPSYKQITSVETLPQIFDNSQRLLSGPEKVTNKNMLRISSISMRSLVACDARGNSFVFYLFFVYLARVNRRSAFRQPTTLVVELKIDLEHRNIIFQLDVQQKFTASFPPHLKTVTAHYLAKM